MTTICPSRPLDALLPIALPSAAKPPTPMSRCRDTVRRVAFCRDPPTRGCAPRCCPPQCRLPRCRPARRRRFPPRCRPSQRFPAPPLAATIALLAVVAPHIAMPPAATPPDTTATTPPDAIPPVATRPIAMPPPRCHAATPPVALLSGSLSPVVLSDAVTPNAALAASDLNGLFPAATRPSRRQATATMTATPQRPKGRGRVWWWEGGVRVR